MLFPTNAVFQQMSQHFLTFRWSFKEKFHGCGKELQFHNCRSFFIDFINNGFENIRTFENILFEKERSLAKKLNLSFMKFISHLLTSPNSPNIHIVEAIPSGERPNFIYFFKSGSKSLHLSYLIIRSYKEEYKHDYLYKQADKTIRKMVK